MSLAINARFLSQPMSGVQRYGRELIGALDARLARDPALWGALGPVVAYAPEGDWADPGWRMIRVERLGGGRGHVWEQGALWRASRDQVLLSPGNAGPLRHRRQVLVLHDANLWEMPEAYTRRYRMLHRAMRPRLARRAAELITVSRFSVAQLAARLGVEETRFSIVPNAADHLRRVGATPGALARFGLVRGGYLLCVGNQSPNKNIARLVAAHGRAGELPPLVVAGGVAPGLAAATGDVRLLGRLPDGMLRALYEGAAGFVFPSLHEGFGIPPLEAMGLGCPVLAARSGALPEVLGDAALWCDPLSEADMTRGLRALCGLSPAGRAALIRAGRARAARFDWDRSVEALLPVLHRAAGASAAPGSRPSGRARRLRTG